MLYILYGPDSFSRREALVRLKTELDSDGMLETNTTLLDARDASPQEVMAACDTVPFLGTRRLVIVENLLQQADGGGKAKRARKGQAEPDPSANPWHALADYIERMPETTTLVLIDDDAGKDGLLASLQGKAQVTRFDPPGDRALPQWIQARAKDMDLRMDSGAARALGTLVGSNTWSLANEMKKLGAYAGGQEVHEPDVRGLVHDYKEQKGYLLADAVADGKAAAATRLLHELRTQGEPQADQLLLATISGRYRRLAIVREMLDAGSGSRAIGERLRMNPGYGLDRLIEQASHYPMTKIRAAFARIVQAEMDTKLGLCEQEVSLELLIEDLAAVVSSRAA